MSWKQVIQQEWRAIFTNPVVMLTIFGGVIFYSFLYPLPYAKQVPLEQAITVVNLDKSKTSYELERMVDATSQVRVVERAHSIEQAKAQFVSGEVRGILVIPEHFYRDLLRGKSPTLSYAGDASYFLVYGTIVEGLARAGGTLAAGAKIARLVMEGVPVKGAMRQHRAIELNMKPTFNSIMGYVGYVVPAVFVLILQQTLVMGVGIVGVTCKAQSSAAHLLVRILLFVAIYLLLMGYYFGWSFDYYNIGRLAEPVQLLIFAIPFLVAASMVGVLLGRLLPRRELVTAVVLMSSMPLVFSAGFIWPVESVPEPLVWLSNLFPSTPAIQGFLRLNQMGADFQQVLPQYFTLWVQVLGWGTLVWFLSYRSRGHR